MGTKSSIIYVTYTGLATDTNGVSTQVRITLDAISSLDVEIRARVAFTFAFALPNPNSEHYSAAHRAQIMDEAQRLGVEVELLQWSTDMASEPSTDDRFWTPSSWDCLTSAAVSLITRKASACERVLVLACDMPLSGLCRTPLPSNVEVVYVPMSLPSEGWEHEYLVQSLSELSSRSNVRIARFGDWVSDRLVSAFAVGRDDFVRLRGGVPIGSDDYLPMTEVDAAAEFTRRDLRHDDFSVAMVARLDPRKGISTVLRAVRTLGIEHRLLLVAPDTHNLDVPELDDLSTSTCYHVTDFRRPFARAVFSSQIPVLAFASTEEVLPNTVFEAALQSRYAVMVVPNSSGYVEQVPERFSSLRYSLDSERSFVEAIQAALMLTSEERSAVVSEYCCHVSLNFDFRREFQQFVDQWNMAGLAGVST